MACWTQCWLTEPSSAPSKDITATYDKGVLTVRAPMGAVEKHAHRIEIATGSQG